MRFSTVSAVVGFAASVYAQTAGFDAITSPTQDQTVAAGSTLNIVWEPTAAYNKETVSITLLQGATPGTLSAANVITSLNSSLGTYSWAIPADIASFATYGFQLTLNSDSKIFQYSFPFHITTASISSSSATGSAYSTRTMTLSTGTAYTPSSSLVSTASANSSTAVTTTSSASTFATASVTAAANSTLSYVSPTVTSTSTASASKSSSGSATTTTKPAAATTNAAVGNVATGSMALFGGLVLAFAL